ncbi:MAG: ADOP family duplicated permease [Vicinamibacterales bacterium]
MNIVRHLLAWLRRDRLDDELREELAQHREWTADRLIAEGVSPDDARRQAAVQIGNPLRLREQSRGIWGFAALDTIAQDVRYGLRLLRRAPLFTLATVATLGLTIGATSALFAVANAVVWRPLPYPESSRIMSISVPRNGRDTAMIDESTARIAMTSHVHAFESFASYNTTYAGLMGGAEPERVLGARVSEEFFDVMRVQPALGRSFVTSEMQTGGPAAIVVSDSLWNRAFGRNPDILGQTVTLDDRRYPVVGVIPEEFQFPNQSEFWLPLLPRTFGGGGIFFVDFIGRLRRGVPMETARNELVQLRESRAHDLPAFIHRGDIYVMPLHDRLYGDLRGPIVLLLAAVVCVLLIGCANVANLLLARGAVRRPELALRAALGASRGRITRQLLIESVLIALLGGLPALAIVYEALHAFHRVGPAALTRIPGIAVNLTVLGFLLGITIAVGLLFGVAPALSGGLSDPNDRLKIGGGRARIGMDGVLRRGLVTVELAAAVVVIIGASLLVKSLIRFDAIDPGFRADGVLTASVQLPRSRYADAGARRAFFGDVLERVRALPGVESAAIPGDWNPMSFTMPWSPGSKTSPGGESTQIAGTEVGAANFRTFGIPITSGRECKDREPAGTKPAVINATMERLAFAGRSALGQTLTLGREGTFTIIGVSADVRDIQTNALPLPTVFECADPEDPAYAADIGLRARSGIDPASLAPALRKAVANVDPELPVVHIATARQLIDEAGASRQFDALLFGGFAALAFTLATFGLYAVTAYLVAQRTHEFGVRVALGAGRGAVVLLVLRQGLGPAVTGVGLGLLAATALTRLLHSMLFEVSTLDASVFAGVASALLLVSVIAAVIPAFRAVRIDPVAALRAE